MIRWALILVAVLVLIAIGTAAMRFQTALRTRNAFHDIRDVDSPLTGKAAPWFSLPQAGGGSVGPEQFRGKTVLLSFWSSF